MDLLWACSDLVVIRYISCVGRSSTLIAIPLSLVVFRPTIVGRFQVGLGCCELSWSGIVCLLPLSFFYLYFNTSIPFLSVFTFFIYMPPFFHFYFFIFSIFLLPHISRCVVVHVGGLYVICQLSMCSPIGM